MCHMSPVNACQRQEPKTLPLLTLPLCTVPLHFALRTQKLKNSNPQKLSNISKTKSLLFFLSTLVKRSSTKSLQSKQFWVPHEGTTTKKGENIQSNLVPNTTFILHRVRQINEYSNVSIGPTYLMNFIYNITD